MRENCQGSRLGAEQLGNTVFSLLVYRVQAKDATVKIRCNFNFCLKMYFRAVFMEFYGRNDITLGGFLEIYCFR